MKIKHSKKLIFGLGIGLGAALLLSSCTQNFCSDIDFARMTYPYEQGVTIYCTETEYNAYAAQNPEFIAEQEAEGLAGYALKGNTSIYKYIPYSVADNDGGYPVYTYKAKKATLVNNIVAACYKNGYRVPSVKYFAAIDDFVLRSALYMAANPGTPYTSVADIKWTDTLTNYAANNVVVYDPTIEDEPTYETNPQGNILYINPYLDSDTIGGTGVKQIKNGFSLLKEYGYVKFSGYQDYYFRFYEQFNSLLLNGTIKYDVGGGVKTISTTELEAIHVEHDDATYNDSDYFVQYRSTVNGKSLANRSCIATIDGYFGHYGLASDWEVHITKKDLGYAYSKGPLEGLLVYPVSWMVDMFASTMDPGLSGLGQIWALVFVTLIVRGLLILLTFKQTMDQQKMQALAPELAKIQAKYPNSNTNQAEKQRMSQEQMALYKRNKINPLGQILMMVIQFPIFICVWSGLQGSAALSTGSFLNMRLSDTIREILFNTSGNWVGNEHGWWTALILFILMAATQIFAMILPRLITKAQQKKVPQLSKNPAQNSQGKTMKWVSIIMIGFTIVMGFMLPSAMGIYWLIGGLISITQTLVTQLIIAKRRNKKRK